MKNLCFLLIYSITIFPLSFSPLRVYSQVTDYLLELGKEFFREGNISQAKIEFEKVLLIDSTNKKAKEYLEKIRKKKIKKALDLFSQEKVSEEEIFFKKEEKIKKEKNAGREEKTLTSRWRLKGKYQASLGITGQDIIWKRANWDLNEKDWRLLSSQAYNQKVNTYDPAIFSQLNFDVNYSQKSGWGFHTNIDISPWSFIGKSDKITIGGVGTSDIAEVELKYWAPTGYTINETVYTLRDGASISLPELKVVDGKVPETILESTWTAPWPGAYFILPETKIHREFWPLRELWFDYNFDNFKFRIFPVALENQAYTSDDILGLSNHKIYWEESPWLDSWQEGHFNSGGGDFSKGFWDDSLSWFTRDSEGRRLTNLRGISLNWQTEASSLDFSFASPKTLWQDYEEFDSYAGAMRGKYFLKDNLYIGGICTLKLGYDEDEKDAVNQVIGVDFVYGLKKLKVSAEVAKSNSSYDKTSSYKSSKRGWAAKIAVVGSSCDNPFEKNYFALSSNDKPFCKFRLQLTHMDEGFEAGLSSFRQTRKDTFWSRHIHFGEPFKYRYIGLYEPLLRWEDVEPFRIGDGIDYGRDVISLRVEGNNFLEKKLDWLFDIRNVHHSNGKYLETVTRLESTYRATPKLTTKFLGIYHHKPDTIEGIDPFIFDVDTGEYYLNDAIEGGKDPSLKTISLGAEYKINKNVSFYGIWERTNDSTLAYDNFPRSILRDTSFTTYEEEGKTYRKELHFLYGQENFPQPPYPFYNIFKLGLNTSFNDNLKMELDWTHNDYKYAGQIDDNINHVGLGLEYKIREDLFFFFKYVYSKWNDVNKLISGEENLYDDHHNFFTELKYKVTPESEFLLQYGVFSRGLVGELIYDPYGGYLPVLDTQHIVRLFYRRKF